MFYCLDGPGASISFNPADEAIIEIQGQSIGPIVCSAQCNPHCQFYWIKPDETVVDGSNLEIPNLSKNDHGIFACHAGNGYSNNATKNLLLTVNCKFLILKFDSDKAKSIVKNTHCNMTDWYSMPYYMYSSRGKEMFALKEHLRLTYSLN